MKLFIIIPVACCVLFYRVNLIKIPCNETYQANNGHFCRPCSPGYSKHSDCEINFGKPQCIQCPAGTFSPYCDNSTKCVDCKTCSPGQDKGQECTPTSDTVCQCKTGTFWVPDQSVTDEGHCKKHSKCKAGEGIKTKGTPYSDTICEPCVAGKTYSTHNNTCVQCKTCPTTYQQNCTPTTDAICSDKHRITTNKAPHSDSELPTGTIVWICLSPVALLLVATIVFAVIRRRRRKNKSDLDDKSDNTGSKWKDTHNNDQVELFSIAYYKQNNGEDADLETDAIGVPPRQSTSSPEGSYPNQSERDNTVTTETQSMTPHQNSSEMARNGSALSYSPHENQRRPDPASEDERRGYTEQLTDNDWTDMNSFISEKMDWGGFMRFFRRLWTRSNTTSSTSVDTEIKCVELDVREGVRERMVQLMKRWNQVNPSGTPKHIVQALKEINLNTLANDFKGKFLG